MVGELTASAACRTLMIQLFVVSCGPAQPLCITRHFSLCYRQMRDGAGAVCRRCFTYWEVLPSS